VVVVKHPFVRHLVQHYVSPNRGAQASHFSLPRKRLQDHPCRRNEKRSPILRPPVTTATVGNPPSLPTPGLTAAEAASRLGADGPNAIPERRADPTRAFLEKLSGPVPWMLQAALVLEVALQKLVEALIVVALLLLNAIVSFIQETRARDALALLRARLRVVARVRRDGRWTELPAEDLVHGDLVHVSLGDFVPADLRLEDGAVLLDQSSLTGASALHARAHGARGDRDRRRCHRYGKALSRTHPSGNAPSSRELVKASRRPRQRASWKRPGGRTARGENEDVARARYEVPVPLDRARGVRSSEWTCERGRRQLTGRRVPRPSS